MFGIDLIPVALSVSFQSFQTKIEIEFVAFKNYLEKLSINCFINILSLQLQKV